MNERMVLITLIGLLCQKNVLLGFKEETVSNNSTTPAMVTNTTISVPKKTTLIPPGRCFVSLSVNPSPAILGSLVTFYSMLNCSVIPPIEYQCCYYFWQDNLSDNVTVTAGLTASFLSKIYESRLVKKNKYIMEVTVCWQKTFVKSSRLDITHSVCDYPVAVNTTIFELTDTLNGILKFKQDRDYPGSSSVLMVGKEAAAVFVPTDQRLEILAYKWSINGSDYPETNDSSIQFIPANVGILSVELHVFDNVSHNIGSFKHFIHCKESILNAFIKGDKHLLVENNGTFILTYVGSAPFTFCWEVEPSDSPQGPICIYDLSNTDDDMGRTIFYVQARSESGQQKIFGNLTNDVSKKVLTFEFQVFARVNIQSGVLVIILIVGILMSSMLTYIICRQQPERRQRLPVEVADFDFYPGLTPTRDNCLPTRIHQYYEFKILPLLIRLQQIFKPAVQKREMYIPLNGSCPEERSAPSDTSHHNPVHSKVQRNESSNSSTSEHPSESLEMKTIAPILKSPHSNYVSLFDYFILLHDECVPHKEPHSVILR